MAPEQSGPYDTEESRTCATCAVSILVTPPKIERPPSRRDAAPAPIPRPVRICRLNPPRPQFINGEYAGLSQDPVMDAHVCWHWKKPGTLPGD